MSLFRQVALLILTFSATAAGESILPINNGWSFKKSNDTAWLPAKVPGSVHLDLLENKSIPDPYFSDNEKMVQWVDSCDWEYACTFDVKSDYLKSGHHELDFQGLDTYAEVFLNGISILKADNMFRAWRVDVKGKLKTKANRLVVRFSSAERTALRLQDEYGTAIPGGERVFVRKAAFQWGWDFAPRFLGCGIWKPVNIHFWNDLDLTDVRFRQLTLDDALASLEVSTTVVADKRQVVELSIGYADMQESKSRVCTLVAGTNNLKDTIQILQPIRWWTHDLGAPFLYDIRVTCKSGGKTVFSKTSSIGLRTLELSQRPDSVGRSFTFLLNGVPVFMKGANTVPSDVFVSRIDSHQVHIMIDDAVACNVNMLRVWGGGVYPSDEFYDACDRKGVLVWQDFMAACSMLPGNPEFISSMIAEVGQQVTRLRNHPSLALWCGNNEIDEGWHNWGWQKEFGYSKEDSAKVWNDYRKIFHESIPATLKELDPDRPYWPSSPSIGWGRKESLLSGDAHYWGVWWGMEPFFVYTRKVGRFMSEYGFQGMPSMASLRQFAGSDRLDTSMSVMRVHQKHPTGYQTIKTYLDREYNNPKDFKSFVYVSQLLQAGGVKTAIEAHRRAMPRCMGTLYWQFNDCWPGISWSSRDYYGRWKALNYAVRSSYEPMLISPVVKENRQVEIYVVSDSLNDWLARMELRIVDMKGNVRWSELVAADIKANSSSLVYSGDLSRIVQGTDTSNTFLDIRLMLNERIVTERLAFFCLPKSLKLARPSYTIRSTRLPNGGPALSIRSSVFVKGLEVSIDDDPSLFSENYIDMLPDTDYVIPVRMAGFRDEDVSRLRYRSLYDSY